MNEQELIDDLRACLEREARWIRWNRNYAIACGFLAIVAAFGWGAALVAWLT